jgi:hypothetical protein
VTVKRQLGTVASRTTFGARLSADGMVAVRMASVYRSMASVTAGLLAVWALA